MSLEKFEQVSSYLIEHSLKRGATEAEVFCDHVEQTKIKISRGEIEELGKSRERGVGLRIITEGKLSFGSTSSLSADSLSRLVDTCFQGSALVAVDEHVSFVSPPASIPDPSSIIDKKLTSLPVEEKINLARRNEEEALAYDPRIISVDASTYTDQVRDIFIANSKGVNHFFRTTLCQVDALVIARENNHGTKEFDYFAAPDFETVSRHETGRNAARRAIIPLGGKPVRTGSYPVIFEPLAAIELLQAISSAFFGDSIMKGSGFLGKKLGKSVCPTHVTVIDDGLLAGGVASAPLDSEGYPRQTTTLIENGYLQGMLFNAYTAAKTGKRNTGNSFRQSYRGKPFLNCSNLFIVPGSAVPATFIKAIDEGFYVTSTTNTGGINPQTGSYSVSASGSWINRGELTNPVDSVTLSGTLSQILKRISGVGADLTWMGNIGAPTLLIDSLTVGGTARGS